MFTETLKELFERVRPKNGITGNRKFNIRHLLTNFSLPSGDSAQVNIK